MNHLDRLRSLLDRANDLKQLPRTGWLLAGVAAPESVADHSFAVAVLALFLAELVNEDWAAEGLDGPLDAGEVARLALIHDLAESVLTDLPLRSAELLGATAKHEAEERAMIGLLADLPGASDYVDRWRAYDAASTPEARLVKDADKLEMVHQARRYERRGHVNLGEFQRDRRWNYEVSRRLFAALTE
jgi:putative hydrolase of HD superfamily